VDYLILLCIGLIMGLFGGLLGIGGSIVMIPALTLVYGENQHLYQASAMICNFFVAAASLVGHWRAEAFVGPVLKRLIPAAIIGILAGVAMSNCPCFEGTNSYWLTRLFGAFLVYVAVYNLLRFRPRPEDPIKPPPASGVVRGLLSAGIGLLTGLGAGLLGIGAGTVSTPLQQVCLKMRLRNAMSNSAAIIVGIAWLGAIYKNVTLGEHGLDLIDSVRIAVIVLPTGILGGYLGGHLMHALPKNLVRAVFVAVCILAAVRLLTVQPGT
jgi:uncharacterized membrane protein YfcA